MLDFTGHACLNCRKMEASVWSDNQVYSLLNEELVIIQLYVDDKQYYPKQNNSHHPIAEKGYVQLAINGVIFKPVNTIPTRNHTICC